MEFDCPWNNDQVSAHYLIFAIPIRNRTAYLTKTLFGWFDNNPNIIKMENDLKILPLPSIAPFKTYSFYKYEKIKCMED